jgi:hypothetical protein
VPFKRLRAYPVRQAPIPFSASTLYRWEAAGLIKLIRVGGKTMISDEDVDRILAGKAAIPEHPRRQGARQIKPKSRKGRPPKKPPQIEGPAPSAD